MGKNKRNNANKVTAKSSEPSGSNTKRDTSPTSSSDGSASPTPRHRQIAVRPPGASKRLRTFNEQTNIDEDFAQSPPLAGSEDLSAYTTSQEKGISSSTLQFRLRPTLV